MTGQGSVARSRKEASKQFFFEKKNQKTFDSALAASWKGPRQPEQKLFASFSRKRRPFFLRCSTTCLAALFCFAATAAEPEGLRLAPQPDAAAFQTALAATAGEHALSHAAVFADQSFRLVDHGRQAGTLVSGRGTRPAPSPDADPVNTCFVSLVPPGSAASAVLTVGAGDWETEACAGVSAVGLLADSGADHRVAIVYRAAAPHAAPLEPVVLAWSQTGPLRIDAAASRRASLAGAGTVAEIRAALR